MEALEAAFDDEYSVHFENLTIQRAIIFPPSQWHGVQEFLKILFTSSGIGAAFTFCVWPDAGWIITKMAIKTIDKILMLIFFILFLLSLKIKLEQFLKSLMQILII